MNTTRTRWAAIGAAIAITLGAGGIGITHATTDSGPMPIFLPLDEPCRLADTRPAPDTVGPRTTGIGPAETYDLDGWGAVGDCTLPNDTAALVTNVTAVGATQQTNLRFFPQGAALPTTANLNPSPGASATPNAVTVGLNDTNGQFSVFNAFGTVAVIIDVIGYYDDHVHTGDDIVDGSLTAADSRDEPGVAFGDDPGSEGITTTPEVIHTVVLRPPADGYVTVHVTASWFTNAAGQIQCQITDGGDTVVVADPIVFDSDPDGSGVFHNIAAHRTFEVERFNGFVVGGDPFNFVCRMFAGNGTVSDIEMTAMFAPTSYAAPVLVADPLDESG